MQISIAQPHEIDQAVDCLASAFVADPITRFLLQGDQEYQKRLRQFFLILMRARLTLGTPVLLSRDTSTVDGAAMGYATSRPEWPSEIMGSWEVLERSIPGFNERMSVYDGIAESFKPQAPHYYLGAIGIHPAKQGFGTGAQLLQAFCALSDSDQESAGVYLETANPVNVKFYERARFTIAGSGNMGSQTVWCMFRPSEHHRDA